MAQDTLSSIEILREPSALPGGEELLHQLFEARVEEEPGGEALVWGGMRLTYGELSLRADRLARQLAALGIGPEVPVGICSRRSPDMVVGMLAALKAGGAYLPLDPKYPRKRLRFMLEDAGAPVVLADATSAASLPETRARLVFLDAPHAPEIPEASALAPPTTPDNLAYLIYTSGSTGRPKGVAIPHKSAVHLMRWARELFPSEDLEGVLAATSICFDLSVFEIFVPLSWGGRVILADNALALPSLPAAAEVTLVNTVPSAASELVRSGGFPPSVRTINLAGEAFQRSLVDQLYRTTSALAVFNLYGPSEDTTYSTWARVPRDSGEAPTIGVPLPGETCHVLTAELLPVPDGWEGELYLGGPALARGYLARPDLTAGRFLPDPFSPEPGARLYRTGDLVRARPDGELDFLGRIDHQVKIRGFRIELGEVEAALLDLPGVKECVVVARPEESGPRLVAYVAPGDLSIPDLRRSLAARLPEHMVPSAFVLLPALPLTPNGKVDRKALPAPGRARPEVGPYVAPRDETEERLAELWAEALGLDQVGVEDDFFELGGHSLAAGRLLSRIGPGRSVRELFSAPTVAAFARLLRAGTDTDPGAGLPLAGAARGLAMPPLSFGQHRLFFTHRLESAPIVYNVPLAGTLSGDLDAAALRRAFAGLVRRHEALRTVFGIRDGEEVQVILPPAEVPLPVLDLTGLPGVGREEAARGLAWEESRRPFDLQRGPVLRAVLLRMGAREHRLLLTVHHVAWDDGTLAVVARELPVLYRSFAEGGDAALAPLPATCADYAVWQRARLQGRFLHGLLERWREVLSPPPEPLELPADRPRPAAPSGSGAERLFEIPERLARALQALARRHGATSFMAWLALYEALLARLSGQDDFVVVAPVSIRGRVELEPLAGFFVNNLFLRARVGDDPTVDRLVERARETALAAFELQELPFELAVERLDPPLPGGISSLLRALLSVYPQIPGIELAPGLRLLLREVGNGTAKADLGLFLEERPNGRGLGGRLEYASDLFDAVTVQRIEGWLLLLAEGAAADPGLRLSELPLLSEPQRAQLFREWNDTAADFPRQSCVHARFGMQAALRPGAVAVEDGAGRLTYGELDRRASLLARQLRGMGVGRGAVVGICLERSAGLIVSLLAVLKAGGAYLPLDPDYPRERLSFMLADSGAQALVTRSGLLARFGSPDEIPPVLLLDAAPGEPGDLGEPGDVEVDGLDLAYVIYTSGSTGRPKAVSVTHRGVLRLLLHTNFLDVGPDDRIAQVSNISFDAATLEIWSALLHGGRVVVIERGHSILPEEMEEEIRARGITFWVTPPAVMSQAVAVRPAAFSPLRYLVMGGEAADPRTVRTVLESGPPERMINGYGPTECTVMATWHEVREVAPDTASIPIGRPISNTVAVVLDPRQVPVPPGVPGELCLGGDGVAQGYLGRPDLTAERFIPDPGFGDRTAPGSRLYRTGDLVRQRPDGVLEILGRIDHQVKVHGLRIELGEIEAALRALPLVRDAAAGVRRLAGDVRLVAWVVPAAGAPEGLPEELQRLLKAGLPLYMIPSSFVLLESLPLTPVGKVDRRALPDPELEPEGWPRERVAPRNAVEELLAGIWSEVLGRDRIGVHDPFFELGGHSLLILRVLSRVREALGADLVPRDLFDAPTIAALAERIAARDRAQLPPIVPVPRDGELPPSHAQQRLWFLERLGTSGAYNVPLAWRIEGELDALALGAALTGVVRRHEALRTAFPARGGEPVQSIGAPSPVPLPWIDLSGLPPAARERELERLARAEAARPFDLESGPPLRARLLRLAQGDHLWQVTFHHAVTDAWSCAVFAREISQLYSGLPLPDLPVQYADYAVWQRQWLETGVLAEQLAWWTRRLEGLETLELPTDRPRPPVQTWRGAIRSRRLPAGLSEGLRSLGRSHCATRFMTLLAVAAALLERCTGQRDLAFGTPVSNRNRPEIEALIGFFVNTLVLRVDCDAAAPFADLLSRVRESALSAWARPDLPFERLVEEMRPERRLGHSPLFQVVFTYQGEAVSALDLAGLAASAAVPETGTAKFDLTVGVRDLPGELILDLDYSTDLFDAATIDRMALGFERLLAEAVARPGDPLESLDLLGEAGRRQLLAWGRGEEADVAATIPDLFEEQVRRRPGALALRHDGGEMTYAELDARAGALAAVLMAEGVGPDRLVGLLLERSPEAIVAILAILKAGGAFAPLDPSYPAERLAFMLEDLGAPVLITRRGLWQGAGRLPETAARVLCWEDLEDGRSGPGRREVSPDNLAYVMYTSGSTGRPKGVAVTHRNVVRLVRGSRYADLGAGHVFLHLGPLSFDATTLEIGYSLLSGSALAIPPPELPSLAELGGFLVRHQVTAAWLTAGLFHQMVEDQLASLAGLRLLLAGGDVLSPAHVARLLAAAPGITVVNGYGPTESTAFTSCHAMRSADRADSPLPIGRPLGNTRALAVDRHLRLAPPGVKGELWVGGEGLARGYLGRPELTAERFVPDPFGRGPGERLYRTGDLVRWRADGVLEFFGRMDHQVKLRGFRIEPGEIEAVLASHPQVAEAAVVVQGEGGDKRLAAFWVGVGRLDEETEPDLRAFVRERLPAYMVPAAFVRLEALPLDPNGKVNRKALARIAPARQSEEAEREAPRNAAEEILAGIWAEVLGLEQVGIREDFFAIGGHSLLALRVLSRVREVLGADLAPRDLFDAPTIAELAERIASRTGGKLPPIVPAPRQGDLPLSYAQHRLWFLERMGTGPGTYNVPLAWRIGGELDVPALGAALTEVVRRHEALRTAFPARDGEPVQSIAPPSPVPMPRIDLSGLPAEAREREARRIAREEAAAPFDLETGPLVRARLIRLAADDHLWLVGFHHAVTDGWSCAVFAREVSRLYAGLPLPGLPVQYADYALWQREWLEGGVLAEQLAWWTRRLEGLEVLELPTDRPRPPVQTWGGAVWSRRLPADLSERLRSLVRSHRVTPFMALLATAAALLERYTGRRDLALGTPVANRNRPEIEPLIGFFVNTLVLRVGFDGIGSFADLLARVRESTLAAFARPDLPFERLVEEMRPERQLSHSPLFQVLFTYQTEAGSGLVLPGLAVSESFVETGTAKFDLTVGISGSSVELEYNADLFDASTIDRMALGFERLLARAVARPGEALAWLEILDEAERRQLVVEEGGPPEGRAPLAVMFEAQAARTPEAVALEAEGEELTYAELDRLAGRLAGRLRALGVGPEVPVAVCAGRSARLVAGLLAVLKAGGFYVPLDPAYPAERLAFTLQDSAAAVLLTEERWLGRLPEHGARTILLDGEDAGAGLVPAREMDLQNLAYAIYTSGSTGRPKGVAITHGSAAALVRWAQRAFDRACLECVLASTSVCFDLSVFELFVPLTCGGRVVLVENALALTPETRVTLVNTVPSAMTELARLEAIPPSVRVVNLAGEPLRGSLVEAVYRSSDVREVRNLYGPSEDTTYSTWSVARCGDGREPSIGRPVDGTRACVVDARLRLVPAGVPGELLLGGAGLARGYLARPDLTAERFVPDPFSGEPGERLYRTGDLVRWRPDGELEFLGRLDHQVKLRGFRIELGEIEAALREQPGVQDALALVRALGGEDRLVAYVLGEAADLRAGLAAKLPEYMVPAAFVRLDAFPLTPTGKVDRKRLPAPEADERAGVYEAPRNEVEEALAAIWCEVLGRERVGIRDDFFTIGGHSLLATRVISRVRRDLGTDLPLRTIFEAPTVADLAQALARAKQTSDEIPRRASRADRFPVSFSQLRLWLLDRLEPGTAAYNLAMPLRLDGPLDRAALEGSLAEIVRRHEGLRTVFDHDNGGEPVQVVLPGGEIRIPLIDLSVLPPAARDREARRLTRQDQDRGFDLSRWPLLRATLVLLEPGRHDFLFVVHHAVSDGWSMDVLFRELGALYEAFSEGRPSPLPELPIQYPDFAVWQRRRLQGPYLESLLAYWRGQLAKAGHALDLPTDRQRPPVLSFRGAQEILRLPGTLVDGLRRREGRGRTAFMILLGALEALLSRWSAQDDFCVGTYIANRNRAEIEGLIGFFVNTLVLRADLGSLGESPTFDRLLDQVARTTLGAYMHQDLPLERLLEELQPRRDPSRTPIFQVMLNLQNMPAPPLRFGELTMSHLPLEGWRSNFDLTFWFQPDERGMELGIEYSTDLFDRSTVQRLAGQYLRLLGAALAEPGTALGLLPLLGEAERRQVLAGWNGTALETHAEVPVHARFEEQARRLPGKPAVEMAGTVMTYAELDRRATSLALALRRRGVGPETVVGVSLRRSPEMVVALLGVLKSGGAYLPLDPDYPRERLAYMLREAKVPLVLTDARSSAHLPLQGVGIFDVEEAAAEGAGPLEVPSPEPDNLVYLIFTSGSTGQPKGVMVTHRSLANHTASAVAGYEVRESDRILQFASLSFDTSAEEIYPCLAAGATLVLRDDSMLTSTGQFLAAVDRLGITVLNFPTAFWHEIAAGLEREGVGLPPSVRLVIAGGETMLKDRMESWFRAVSRRGDRVRLMNSYGPTEGTVVATRGAVEPGRLAPSGDPPLGRPIHNVQVYVLDRHLEPAPIGLPGEAYIGGMGVARGYLGRPDLTAERFIPDPFGGEPGARLYRTGDRVRWLASGGLDFLGRVDQQVKIRGFRVEVGEVEEALRGLPGVRDAVVEARPDGSGTHRLVAWVVPQGEALPADLRGLLKERLPDYMVPSLFVPLAEVPKTPSSKIDRKALPEPEPPRPDADHAEPRSELERVISGIWQQVLGVGRVGIHDNFFDLGGHSLLMVQAHGRLREALGRDFDILFLFQRPTVSALARELSQKPAERPAFAQAQELARHQRQVNTGRKQFMEQMMKQRKGRS